MQPWRKLWAGRERAPLQKGFLQIAECELEQSQWLWSLGSLCALHRIPFSAELIAREFPQPCTHGSLLAAARHLGFRSEFLQLTGHASELGQQLQKLPLPLLVNVQPLTAGADRGGSKSLALITAIGPSQSQSPAKPGASESQVQVFEALSNVPQVLALSDLVQRLAGQAWLCKPAAPVLSDPDQPGLSRRPFGFSWFVPELLKHRSVWRDVLVASLALQLMALATPLFTQAIIDKVVVHRTQSTLIAIGVAMVLFTIFSSALTWVRQYLVLHTGNRVDAVLGAAVWRHLLAVPLSYFQRRPTGVVAARLQGIETIREFVSGAAIGLILDLPFLLICLGLMLWYSPLLSSVSIVMLVLIALLSIAVSPVFQTRLTEQFRLGAKVQALVTEHVAGIETVKSLQMEPLLRQQHGQALSAWLASGFQTKQIGNSYNVAANLIEQLMTLSILMLGAWQVMTEPSFTIGMLVAFQMFAGKLSQPVLRLVGLWSQFQQARQAVLRLGDVMDMPLEPHAATPQRQAQKQACHIEMRRLGFRYAADLPMLFEQLDLTVEPGQVVAIMGPSGCGKSTLAKLLLGFHAPTEGQILVDGVDTRHLAANELRSLFGVVPQDTTLFSGSIIDNLRAGEPNATFEQVVQATRVAGVHQAVESLPQGYQTQIGERGAGLSGGQKQRLAIARAILKRPRVLIFDEATSALDEATAEAFAKTVNSLRGQVGMVFITHHLPRGLVVDKLVQLTMPRVSTQHFGGEKQ